MGSAFGLADRVANRIARSSARRTTRLAPARGIVSFSFDDIAVSAFDNGARILDERGVRGTFYVAGGLAGGPHDGQTMLGEPGYRELASRGHELGHHTFAHRLPLRYGLRYGRDLDSNDRYLDGITGRRRRNFAFPYGLTSPGAQRQVDRRYRSGRGVMPGVNRGDVDLGYLLSTGIKPDSELAELQRQIDDAAENPGWLILFTHDVQDEPMPWGCRPAMLETLVDHALAAGCEVLTVDAALDRMGVAK